MTIKELLLAVCAACEAYHPTNQITMLERLEPHVKEWLAKLTVDFNGMTEKEQSAWCQGMLAELVAMLPEQIPGACLIVFDSEGFARTSSNVSAPVLAQTLLALSRGINTDIAERN